MNYPTPEQWEQHQHFLSKCSEAANEPPVPTKPLGLFGGLFAPTPRYTVLGGYSNPQTICEMFYLKTPPFESDESLPPARAARIAKLREWLAKLPAQQWLEKQPPIKAAFDCFRRIQNRKDSKPAYRKDLAEFAFWGLAHEAAVQSAFKRSGRNAPKPPDADQRRRAAQAARDLLKLCNETSLLKSACVEWQHRNALLPALQQIELHERVGRRERVDAFTTDRQFVDLLALISWYKFGDASPAIMCELAALHVRNPDKVAITKRVAQWKRGRPIPEHVGI